MNVMRLSPNCRNFQLCYLPHSYKNFDDGDTSTIRSLENFILVPLTKRRDAILRCSLEKAGGDDPNVIWCDTRVQRLKLENISEKEGHMEELEISFSPEGDSIAIDSVLANSLSEIEKEEEVLEVQRHSNDDDVSLKHLKIFKTDAIKMIKLTVICNSDLHFEDLGKGNWNRLQNKIRSAFQTYDIHVMKNTLVDLRTCPLASISAPFSPKVGFVFVEGCEMKNDNDSEYSTVTVGRVTGRTEIIIGNVHHISHYHRLRDQEEARRRPIHLYGLEDASEVLQSVMRRPHEKEQFFSSGILISGPSGCGKTMLIRETAKKNGANLMTFNPKSVDEVGGICDHLTKIFTSAITTASRYPTVLYFSRIHTLFQWKDKRKLGRLLLHICALFDSIPGGSPLTVVGSTNKSLTVPLELRRAGRLEKEIVINPPKESIRLKLLEELTTQVQSQSFQNVDLQDVARQTPGYVAQDLVKLVRLALFKCQEESSSAVEPHHMKYAMSRVLPSVLEGAMGVVDIQRALSLDDIAGLHSVKLDLIKGIVWPLNYPQAFRRMGISPPKGILLYGPPGNCKTTLVRALASQHHTNFLSVSAAELFSSGVGDSEKIVSHLFHKARTASPCILFIDELESIVGSRQSSEKKQTSTNESVLSMLLTEMDGVGVTGFTSSSRNSEELGPIVLVVAATNRPDLIDPALLRPGRFDKLIPVPPLDFQGRLELLKLTSNKIPFHDDVDFEGIAKDTEYYSGADLVNLCKEAAIGALAEDMSALLVKDEHLQKAKSLLKPSLSPSMVQAFFEYGRR